ncbi:phage antirepressor KilAC domain-containing protein [Eubacterium sp. 1001713B170207_170306_E7]|uniref:phage antirepressor KilAC domain-containing protein n=1 Tax=Eubacterium sp. 1001713B170207_170306_E7 TaxID=2787097 RepID=UPI00189A412C|nr:phage antirepressor KilAC domain-containing protein [Eubacterium sp. 1001713B170207_170306_E7]
MTTSQKRYAPVCLPQVFGDQSFRTLYDAQDHTVYFVLNDICVLLGHSNARMAAKRHTAPRDVTKRYVLDSNGRYQRTTVVNESGLYALIFGSRLPAARRFKHYVTSQILPSIRKYGAYMDLEVLEQVENDPDACARLLCSLRAALSEKQALEKQLALAGPKILFADAVTGDSRTISMYGMANLLKTAGSQGMSRKALMEKLRQLGYLSVQPGSWNHPTARADGLIELCIRVIWPRDEHGNRLPGRRPMVLHVPRITSAGQVYFMHLFMEKEAAH